MLGAKHQQDMLVSFARKPCSSILHGCKPFLGLPRSGYQSAAAQEEGPAALASTGETPNNACALCAPHRHTRTMD